MNRTLSTANLEKWNNLNHRQLMLIRNLYIRLGSDINLAVLYLLRWTPLCSENKLESITIDLSERREPYPLNAMLDHEIVSMMAAFILASGGSVCKVTLVLSRDSRSVSHENLVNYMRMR